MARKKAHTPEEIVVKLWQAEVLVGQEKTVGEAVRAIGVTEPTYYRWRTEFGGLKLDQVKRLKGPGHCHGRAGERAAPEGGIGPDAGEGHPEGSDALRLTQRGSGEPCAAAGLRRARCA